MRPPLLEVAVINLTTIAMGPGFAHLRSRHWDEAVVGGKKATTRAPSYPGTAKKQIWLWCLTTPMAGTWWQRWPSLLMLWTMMISAVSIPVSLPVSLLLFLPLPPPHLFLFLSLHPYLDHPTMSEDWTMNRQYSFKGQSHQYNLKF